MMKQQEEVGARYSVYITKASEKRIAFPGDLIAGLNLPKVRAADLSSQRPSSSLSDTHHRISAEAHSPRTCFVGVTVGRGLSNSERQTTGLLYPSGPAHPEHPNSQCSGHLRRLPTRLSPQERANTFRQQSCALTPRAPPHPTVLRLTSGAGDSGNRATPMGACGRFAFFL